MPKIDQKNLENLTPGRRALLLLHEAHEEALRQQADPWQHALVLPQMVERGITAQSLQALMLHQLIALRLETPRGRRGRRQFEEPPWPLYFTARSCFLLTPAGVNFVNRHLADGQALTAAKADALELPEAELDTIKPSFVKLPSGHRQLLVLGRVHMDFKYHADAQEDFLQAWENACWIPQIVNPYKGTQGFQAKRRQRSALDRLNRKQHWLRFRGDGSGLAANWEWRVHVEENLTAG